MAFMIPQYVKGEFATVNGEGAMPKEFVTKEDEQRILAIEDGWWFRLSAPGYLDCTDWHGPFDAEHEAREFVQDYYDVHPDTGEDLD